MTTNTTEAQALAAVQPVAACRKPAIIPTAANRFFWEGALQGRLMIARCADCGLFMHPPMPVCGACRSTHVAPEQVSGRGMVHAFTIVRRTFHPGFAADIPYVVAIIALDEQAGLHLVSNVVACAQAQLVVGLPVTVHFEPYADWALPVFRPAASASAGIAS